MEKHAAYSISLESYILNTGSLLKDDKGSGK